MVERTVPHYLHHPSPKPTQCSEVEGKEDVMSTGFAVVPTPQGCSNESQCLDFPCEPRCQAHPNARLAPVASGCRLVPTDRASRPAPIYSWALGNLRSISSLGLASANRGSSSFQWTQALGPPLWAQVAGPSPCTQVSHLSHRLRTRPAPVDPGPRLALAALGLYLWAQVPSLPQHQTGLNGFRLKACFSARWALWMHASGWLPQIQAPDWLLWTRFAHLAVWSRFRAHHFVLSLHQPCPTTVIPSALGSRLHPGSDSRPALVEPLVLSLSVQT